MTHSGPQVCPSCRRDIRRCICEHFTENGSFPCKYVVTREEILAALIDLDQRQSTSGALDEKSSEEKSIN